ncbi:MAG: type II toxin-antitoxin system CcdA family antitoxin [Caulobacteraceae bacterium]|nr:type II toxin-antitoxin system CcdA family antitoxin [Caulobacteraceae bacterium]
MGKVELKLEIDADLLGHARDAGLDPSTVLESELRRRLRPGGVQERGRDWSAEAPMADTPEARAARWAEENAEAIKEHNAWIAKHGLVGDEWRKW